MEKFLLAHAQEKETLSDSLNFQAPAAAFYGRRRNHRAMPPLGGSEYGLQGSGKTTSLRFRLSGDEFVDASTVCLKFKVSNANANNPLMLAAPAYCFFRRLRISINGYQVEEVDDFHRTCSLIDSCSSRDGVYAQKTKQGWWLDQIGKDVANTADGTIQRDNEEVFVVSLKGSGLLNNEGNKFLPLKYLPQIDLELETATIDEALYCLNPVQSATPAHVVSASDITLSDVRLMYDVIMLDTGIEDKFYQHLENGGTLDIPFATWRNSRQVMTANNFSVQVAANVKSARSLFFSVIKKNEQTANAEDVDPGVISVVSPTGLLAGMKPTTAASGQFYKHGVSNFQVQVGNQTMPDQPVSHSAEFMHYLQVAWNKHHSYVDPIGITWQEYNNDLSGPYTVSSTTSDTTDIGLVDLGPYPVPTRLSDGTGAAYSGGSNVTQGDLNNVRVNTYHALRNYTSKFIVGLNLEKLLDLHYSGMDLQNEVISITGKCKSTAAVCSVMLYYNAVLRIGKNTTDLLERS